MQITIQNAVDYVRGFLPIQEPILSISIGLDSEGKEYVRILVLDTITDSQFNEIPQISLGYEIRVLKVSFIDLLRGSPSY